MSPLAEELLFSSTRPEEELYLYQQDPWQTDNLADAPAHQEELERHRARLDRWIDETGDMGTESDEIYSLEMSDELNSMNKKSERYKTFRKNVELYKRWAADEK